jgi:integrase
MATYRTRKGNTQAIIDRKGIYMSRTFPRKKDAEAWAMSIEADIIAGKFTKASFEPVKTVGDLLDKYSKEVSPTKRGTRWEQIRIELLKRGEIKVDGQELVIADIPLPEFDERHVAAWRDMRKKTVTGSSINREWNVFSNAFKKAMREWKWIDKNPWHEVERPKKNKARNRLATQEEIDRLIHSSGYSPDNPPATIIARVMAAALYAMETGKRCKEICQLRPDMVFLEKRVALVGEDTKTGAREVPLSSKAIRILEQMLALKMDTVFGLTESQVDAHWRKLTKKAMVENLTFHDCKHYACTKLAEKVSVFDLGRILGTRDLRTLMIYYNKSASDIASQLD